MLMMILMIKKSFINNARSNCLPFDNYNEKSMQSTKKVFNIILFSMIIKL